jgi:class I lanthipeptide synthase
MRTLTWRPLVGEEALAEACQLIREIADQGLAPFLPEDDAPGLAEAPQSQLATLGRGYAGMSLFYAHLARTNLGKPHDSVVAQRLLNWSIDILAAQPLKPYLFAGFTGTAWVNQYLGQLSGLDGPDDPNAEVDLVLANFLNGRAREGPYDLIVGLVGYGVYALERLPRPAALDSLEAIVGALGKLARHSKDGVTWHTDRRYMDPEDRKRWPGGWFDLGLAHGVPGVIVFLARCHAAGIARALVSPMLEGAVDWLLSTRLPPNQAAIFPYMLEADVLAAPLGRLGWCYGDLGIAMALLIAGGCNGQDRWTEEAIKIACTCVQRAPEKAVVIEAGLCHGAAGVAQIYARLHEQTGISLFASSARHWYAQVFAYRNHVEGILGFARYERDDDGTLRWIPDPGFLTGVSGIGLALLSGVTDEPPAWDRLLLLST